MPAQLRELTGADGAGEGTDNTASGQAVSMLEGFAVFGDPQLLALQRRALDNNADVQMALLRFASSRVQRDSAAGQRQPILTATAAAARQRQSETGSATRLITAIAPPSQIPSLIDFIGDPFALYQAGFDASWEPDLWGRVKRSIEAADAQLLKADAALAQVQLGLLAEVARYYLQWRGVGNQQDILQQDVLRAQARLDLLQARQDAGLGTQLEVLAQQAFMSDLRSRLPALQEQQVQARNGLSFLLGELPGSVQGLLEDSGEWVFTPLPELTLGLPAQVLDTRPDIRASEAQLREVTAQLGIAQADLYPRIILGAGVGLESLHGNEMAQWGSQQWSIGPRFSLPLFDQGRRKAVVELRELAQQEAAIDYQRTVLKAWQEVDNAIMAYNSEGERQRLLADKLRSNEQLVALAQANYRNGLINYLQVLEFEQGLANSRRELTQSQTQLALQLVVLFKSLGRAAPLQGLPASS